MRTVESRERLGRVHLSTELYVGQAKKPSATRRQGLATAAPAVLRSIALPQGFDRLGVLAVWGLTQGHTPRRDRRSQEPLTSVFNLFKSACTQVRGVQVRVGHTRNTTSLPSTTM